MNAGRLRKVVLVEDDPDIQAIARMALEVVGGFETRVYGSGAEAVAAAPGFLPDLILLDVMMPGMDGPSTLLALRSDPALAAVPVVFMTAKAQAHEVQRYKALGAADVISKPFDPMTLAAALLSIWSRLEG